MVSLMASACAGCLHAPPNYPGAGGDNLDPRQFTNEACVDLSGRYEGKGEIVDGDPGSLRDQRTWRLDNVFPFASREQLDTCRLPHAVRMVFMRPPNMGSSKGNRIARITSLLPSLMEKLHRSPHLLKTREDSCARAWMGRLFGVVQARGGALNSAQTLLILLRRSIWMRKEI